jgi:hypothetical protein
LRRGKAADAAQSWGDNAAKDAAARRKFSLSGAAGTQNVEQWAINRAVHYNEWANFGRKDFEPVVAAFKELLECFRCDTCESWLHVTPRGTPETLWRSHSWTLAMSALWSSALVAVVAGQRSRVSISTLASS